MTAGTGHEAGEQERDVPEDAVAAAAERLIEQARLLAADHGITVVQALELMQTASTRGLA